MPIWPGHWQELQQYRKIDFEMVHQRRDGSTFPVAINSNYFQQGRREFVSAFVSDLTERRRAEQALRESEAKYRLVFENAPLGILHFNPEGVVTDINEAFAAITGAPREKILGFHLLRQLQDDNMLQAVRDALAGRIGYYEGDYLSVTGGKKVQLRAFFRSFFSATGELLGGICISEDYSEKFRAEQERQNSLNFLQILMDAIPNPVFYKDVQGHYLGCNIACEEYWGRSRQEIIGKSVFDFNSSELAKVHHDNDLQALRTSSIQVYETTSIRADGQRRDVVLHKARFYNADGTLGGLIGVVLDITERKLAERERERLEAQLFQAQKMEAIGTLAAGIAHDFNNILWAIMGFTELTLTTLPRESPEYHDLQQVLKATERAGDLVNQILTFGRKTDQDKKPLQLSAIISEVLKLLRATIPTTIEIKQDIISPEAMVLADPTRMQQLIMNLCVNSAQAMQENGGTLEIRLQQQYLQKEDLLLYSDLSPGPYVILTVSDTGHGIAAEVIDRIFDPFFTTKGVGEGTGMGLSVVYGIVKAHGGGITVTSQPDAGTSFTVVLPEISSQTAEVSTGPS